MAGPVVISATQVALATPFDNSTNGFVSSDVQNAIEEAAHPVVTEVSATANSTTTSNTDSVITGMTITPAAGDYMVWFSAGINSSNAGSTQHVSMYVGGVQKTDSDRTISPFDGGTLSSTTAGCCVAINGKVTVNGSQAIDIRFRTSGGTATCSARTLNIMRIR